MTLAGLVREHPREFSGLDMSARDREFLDKWADGGGELGEEAPNQGTVIEIGVGGVRRFRSAGGASGPPTDRTRSDRLEIVEKLIELLKAEKGYWSEKAPSV